MFMNLQIKNGLISSVLLGGLLTVTQVSQADYTYTTINDPNAKNASIAIGINNSGQVVGYYGSYPNTSYLYNGRNYAETINDPNANYLGTAAYGINNNGDVTGYFYNGKNGYYANGFVYNGSTYTTLNDPNVTESNSPYGTWASGINDYGQVVGSFTSSASGSSLGFVYNNGNYTNINDPNGTSTGAYGINNSGVVVGSFTSSESGYSLGFIYNNGNYTTIDDPYATKGTSALGINNIGEVVGFYQNNSGVHGFLFNGNSYTTINNPNGTNTYAYGINDSGQISGFLTNSNGAVIGGFVATPTVTSIPVPSAIWLFGSVIVGRLLHFLTLVISRLKLTPIFQMSA